MTRGRCIVFARLLLGLLAATAPSCAAFGSTHEFAGNWTEWRGPEGNGQSGNDDPQLWAMRLDGHGDVTDTQVACKISQRMPSTPSPRLVDDLLYVVNDAGIASCIEAQTGKSVWDQRIEGTFNASPLYGAGRLYFFARNGTTTVLAPGREARLLAVNKFAGTVMASPAVADNALFVRTSTHPYRIGKKTQ